MYMDYQRDTIANIIGSLNNQYFLPAIQRKFVWKQNQIIKLFDSIMQNYPIGSFLFWQLKPENYGRWDIYRFIQDHREDTHNEIANIHSVPNLTLVLDGQQRLTALLIGLKGSDTRRRKYVRWNNPRALVKKNLYLDLLKDPKLDDDDTEADIRYGFAFYEVNNLPKNDAVHHWFPVGRILAFANDEDFHQFKIEQRDSLFGLGEITGKQAQLFEQNLERLYRAICQDHFISYYTEKLQDYDRVLTIFVRANQAGTLLTMSDLLLATVTAKWSGVNARDEIYAFVDHINTDLSRRNNFSKDFVLKTSLVLTDLPVQYKVENFNNQNLERIQSRWDQIKQAIEATVSLVNSFGIDRDTLTSVNALIPIAYYLFQRRGRTLSGSTHFDVTNALRIRRWLLSVLLNEVFGGASDTLLTEMRRILQEQQLTNDFPSEALNAAISRRGRRPYFDKGATNAFLENKYGNRITFLALALLYEDSWQTKREHQDHIFPRAHFSAENLLAEGIPLERHSTYRHYMDSIANLQLLSSSENLEKKDKLFDQWIKTRHPSFRQQHLIPDDPNLYTLDHFPDFIQAREQLIRERLSTLSHSST